MHLYLIASFRQFRSLVQRMSGTGMMSVASATALQPNLPIELLSLDPIRPYRLRLYLIVSGRRQPVLLLKQLTLLTVSCPLPALRHLLQHMIRLWDHRPVRLLIAGSQTNSQQNTVAYYLHVLILPQLQPRHLRKMLLLCLLPQRPALIEV